MCKSKMILTLACLAGGVAFFSLPGRLVAYATEHVQFSSFSWG